MKLNNIQREIINIIKPFMDKTLADDCYINFLFGIFKVVSYNIKYKEFYLMDTKSGQTENWFDKFYYVNNKRVIVEKTGECNCIYTILGHYNIIAILKYINSIKTLREINWETREKGEVSKYNVKFSEDFNHIEIWEDRRLFNKIPNKSLYLYKEEENKHLLNLLKKIGTQN